MTSTNKTALITGVNSLVNKALLAKLVELGYVVTAHYHSDNDITKELKAQYPKVHFIQADFADKEGVGDFLDEVTQTQYDVLVNAAVYYAEVEDWKPQLKWDEWQKNFAVNTTIAGLLMAHMPVTDNGAVINISSTFGQEYMGDIQFAMYSASKAAMDSLTVTYAKKWMGRKRIVGIAPGWVKSSWNIDMSAEDVKSMLAKPQVAKLVEPQEIANLMEAVIKNESINATTLVIDGGLGAPTV